MLGKCTKSLLGILLSLSLVLGLMPGVSLTALAKEAASEEDTSGTDIIAGEDVGDYFDDDDYQTEDTDPGTEEDTAVDPETDSAVDSETEEVITVEDNGDTLTLLDDPVPETYVITSENFSTYFDSDGYLKDDIAAGSSLDFQGTFSGTQYTLYINKKVYIISSTEDAVFTGDSKDGLIFNIGEGADYTSISDLTFENCRLFITNVSNVTVDGISMTANISGVGSGTGFFYIHTKAENITVKNSYFENGGTGSACVVQGKGTKNALFENNEFHITGSSGNVLYATNFMGEGDDPEFNTYKNNVFVAEIGASATCWLLVIVGSGHLIEGNSFTYGGSAIATQFGASVSDISYLNNTVTGGGNINIAADSTAEGNVTTGTMSVGLQSTVTNNDVGKLTLGNECTATDNTVGTLSVAQVCIVTGNTVTNGMQITKGFSQISGNAITGDVTFKNNANSTQFSGNKVTGSVAVESKNNIITGNSVVTTQDFAITLKSSATNNEVKNNVLIAAEKTGNDAVNLVTEVENTVENNAASFSFQNDWIQEIDDQVYTGEAIEPEVIVKNGDYTLTEGTDYSVAYENNTEMGTATVTVSAVDSSIYTGTATATFNIVPPAEIINPPIAIEGLSYTGTAQELVTAGEVTAGNVVYALGEDATTEPADDLYGASIATGINAGTYYVWYKVVGDSGKTYIAAEYVTAEISTASLEGGHIVFAGEDEDGKLALGYTGQNQTVQISAVVIGEGDDAVTITSGDFTVDGSSALTGRDIGKYTVKVAGKNNCVGETTGQWEIVKGQPIITAAPAASDITYGQSLYDSTLTGGEATVNGVKVEGSFSWKNDRITPSPAESGVEKFYVVFTPTDTEHFLTAEKCIAVNVNKYPAIEFFANFNVSNEMTESEYLNLKDCLGDEDSFSGYEVENLDGITENEEPLATALVIGSTGTFEHGCLKYSLRNKVEPGSRCLLTLHINSEKYEQYTIFVTLAAKSEIVSKDFVLENVTDRVYTGTKIKLDDLKVFSAGLLLKEGTDYTVSYVNNTNVGTAKITVKGKGNYQGTQSDTFEILPADISDDLEFSADDFYLKDTGKPQKKTPVLKRNNKTVAAGNYTVKYCVEGTTAATENPEETSDFTKSYVILMTGKGNFEKSRAVRVEISKEAVLLSKAKVSIPQKSYVITKSEAGDIVPVEPEVTVTSGGTNYTKDTDFTVEYFDNDQIGKAYLYVTGNGTTLIGTKKLTYDIKGTSIAKATVAGVTAKVFDPSLDDGVTQSGYSIKLGDKILEDDDYAVDYLKNTRVGTATMVVTGTGIYQGQKKVTFKITKADLKDGDPDTDDSYIICEPSAPYAQGGAKPEVTVIYKGVELSPGTDYSVSCSNNKAAGLEATATITGKGNYSGKAVRKFEVKATNPEGNPDYKLTASDLTYNLKNNTKVKSFLKVPKVTEVKTGKALVAGKDFSKEVVYSIGNDLRPEGFKPLSAGDREKALNKYIEENFPDHDYEEEGIWIQAEINFINNYSGSCFVLYRVTGMSISGVKAVVKDQIFTGDEIIFDPNSPGFKDDFVVYTGISPDKGTKLVHRKDFIIDAGSYKNNIKNGTASVNIIGIGKYSGIKTIKFKIVKKNL